MVIYGPEVRELTELTLDQTDHAILRLLSADSRISNADLAERVGLSASSCWRRVRTLEDAGAIRGYGAKLDDRQIGLTFQAVVQVHLTRHDPDLVRQFMEAVRTKDEVRDCYATTGHSDYHLIVKCRDLAAYNTFLEEFLFRIPAVASAQSNVVLRTIKSAGRA
ncbi:MAG: Lrp/AsnC family transcriptional regulator [Roseivivax sp.]|nr:Lrp/AsnC family transcriptional regulator [Roseivivax sp.]